MLKSHPNPDLTVCEDHYSHWNSAPFRRHGFHNLHDLTRYRQSFRAARVLDLRLSADLSIPRREDLRALTQLPSVQPGTVAVTGFLSNTGAHA